MPLAPVSAASGDTNGRNDIFRHDRKTGETVLVSVGADGAEADSFSEDVAISANGRTVSFWSRATNLVPQDGNGVDDVFVHKAK